MVCDLRLARIAYHAEALQTGAAAERIGIYALAVFAGHRKASQAGAVLKRSLTNINQVRSCIDRCQVGTPGKRPRVDHIIIPFRKRHAGDPGVILKSFLANGANIIVTPIAIVDRFGQRNLRSAALIFVHLPDGRVYIIKVFDAVFCVIPAGRISRKRCRGQQGQQHGHRQKRAQDTQFGRGSGGLFFHFTRLLLVQENPKKKALWFDFTLPQSLQNSY